MGGYLCSAALLLDMVFCFEAGFADTVKKTGPFILIGAFFIIYTYNEFQSIFPVQKSSLKKA